MLVRSSVGATPFWLNPCLQGHPEQYHHSKPWRGCKSYRPVREGHRDLQCIVGGHPASHEKQHVLCKLDGLGDACSVPNSDKTRRKKMHPNSLTSFGDSEWLAGFRYTLAGGLQVVDGKMRPGDRCCCRKGLLLCLVSLCISL